MSMKKLICSCCSICMLAACLVGCGNNHHKHQGPPPHHPLKEHMKMHKERHNKQMQDQRHPRINEKEQQ